MPELKKLFNSAENILYVLRFSDFDPCNYVSFLSDAEKKSVARKAEIRLRNTAILSYGLRRAILSFLLELSPKKIQFNFTDEKKPFLSGYPLHFNVSHNQDWWVMLINPSHEIGVDIENINSSIKFKELSSRFFSKEEHNLTLKKGKEYFLRLWTAKEALLKAQGQGIKSLASLRQTDLRLDKEDKLYSVNKKFLPWALETIIIERNLISMALPAQKTHFMLYKNFNRF